MRIAGFRIVAAALASASFIAAAPQSVYQALDISTPISYFIAEGQGKRGFRDSDRELARWALEAWQRTSGSAIRFESAPESSALVRLYWAEPSEGQYGEMQSVMLAGRLGAVVYIRTDMAALGPDIAGRAARDPLLRDSIVYLTCAHELGHALGLRHTRDYADLMYSFGYGGDIPKYFGRYRAALHARADIAKVSGLSPGDVTKLRALYGIEP
jgi:hypothetical protein